MSQAARVVALARKLRGRDLTELRVRGGQALAAWRERTGRAGAELDVSGAALAARLVDGVPVEPAALLAHVRARRAPRFFPGLDDPAATVAALRARCPADEGAVLARAERVADGRFDLLGYRGLDYGTPLDWHRDPVAGRVAPRDLHWSRVPYLDAAAVGDHKVIWEVNRQQYLVTLGQAWHYSRDPRWPALFAGHVSAWMDANPPKQGINWASSLEVAFRAMSWVWALHLFRDADALTPALHARLLAYLHVHARHLEQYLSTYFSPNTHLTGEALGLVFVGGMLPELAAAPRWLATGLAVLRDWFPRQVRADGTYFEQATQYHRYTTEFVLQLVLLGRRNGWELGEVPALLPRLVEVLAALDRGDGTMPLLGDDDGGRLVQLDDRPPDDLRGLFAQAGAVLDRPELVAAARGDVAPALWLLGPGTLAEADPVPGALAPRRSRAHPDGGLWVLASGTAERTLHAVLDAGPHGVFNGGHAHADALTLVTAAGGRPLLVDAGTYHYPGAERNAFRGASAHNVVLVDGEGASEPAASPFHWERQHGATTEAWIDTDGASFVAAALDGLDGRPDPLRQTREVLHLPGLGWVVRDRVAATAAHDLEARWHLAPGLVGQEAPGGLWRVCDAGGEQVLHLLAVGRVDEVDANGGWAAEPGWVSTRYGQRAESEVAVWRQRGVGAQEVLTFMLPRLGDDAPAAVTSLVVDGPGRAFRVGDSASPSGMLDLVFGPGDGRGVAVDRPSGERLSTDATCAWVRVLPHGAAAGAGLIGGRFVRLGADTIVATPPVPTTDAWGWAVATRRDDGSWARTGGGSGALSGPPTTMTKDG
ncbi:MAG TPA: alginate lyase family protein [Gemmatirosa sp.]|nr:alginate lyase family protein [Gemmatirosa sp.]